MATGRLGDWRGEALARLRELIRRADPAIVEEIKWRKAANPLGVPVWTREGIICTGETYKDEVRLTFVARGASLEDPAGLFNAGLDGKVRRSARSPPASPRWCAGGAARPPPA